MNYFNADVDKTLFIESHTRCVVGCLALAGVKTLFTDGKSTYQE